MLESGIVISKSGTAARDLRKSMRRHSGFVRAIALAAIVLVTSGAYVPGTAPAQPIVQAAAGWADLTGDGTGDPFAFVSKEEGWCQLVISPGDTYGAFASIEYSFNFFFGSNGRGCPDLWLVAPVRDDGSSELFIDDIDSGSDGALTAIVRGNVAFDAETPRGGSTGFASGIELRTGPDGGNQIFEPSYEGNQAYVVDVDGNGHLGSSTEVPSYNCNVGADLASSTPKYGDPNNVHVSTSASDDSSNPGPPTGNISLSIDGTHVADRVLTQDDNGASYLNYELPKLPPGSHQLVTDYSGDSFFFPQTTTNSYSVQAEGTATTFTKADTATVFGQSLAETVKVASQSGASRAAKPDGTAIIRVDGNDKPALTLVNGAASTSVTGLAVGTHSIVARYPGSADGGYLASSTSTVQHVVNQASTAESLHYAEKATVAGQTWANGFYVKPVAPGAGSPTGNIVFKLDGVAQPSITLSAGIASFTFTGLSVGTHTLVGTYSGDSNFRASTSPSFSHVVEKASTTTTVAVSPTSPRAGVPAALTVKAVTSSPGVGTPTGTVSVAIDGGTAVNYPLSSGSATLNKTFAASGSHTIGVTYNGDDSRNSSSATRTLTVVS